MISGNKIIILVFSAVILLSIAGYTYFGKMFRNLSSQPGPMANQESNSTQKISLDDSLNYPKKTLKQEFLNTESLIFRIHTIEADDTSKYKTPTWTKDDVDIAFQSVYTVKGTLYKENDLPLEYNILVKKKLPKNLSDENRFNMINQFFNSTNLDFGAAKKFSLKLAGKEVRFYSANRDNPSSLETVKDAVDSSSNVIEYVWEAEDKTLESRMVWKINEDSSSETDYFIACKVFPTSELFAKKTCFVQKD